MKIKKMICMLTCLAVIIAVTGCGSNNETSERNANDQSSVEDTLQAGMAREDNDINENKTSDDAVLPDDDNDTASQQENKANSTSRSAEDIDIDLTSLSSTMVYSEVSNMMYYPDDYIGKIVKMEGLFTSYHDESTGNNYFACIIQDATACCAQGIEFVLTDDYSYPDDYPEEGSTITVVGDFDYYMEGDYLYCTLRNADLEN